MHNAEFFVILKYLPNFLVVRLSITNPISSRQPTMSYLAYHICHYAPSRATLDHIDQKLVLCRRHGLTLDIVSEVNKQQ